MKKSRFKRIGVWILALALCLQALPSFAWAEGEDDASYIKSVDLRKGKQPLPDNSEVSFSDDLTLRYSLRDLAAEDADVIPEVSFSIELPAYLTASQTLDQPVKVEGDTLGTVEYQDLNHVKFTFSDDEEIQEIFDGGGITDIWFEFSSQLGRDEVGGRQKIEIPLSGSMLVNLTVTDNAVRHAKLAEKTGSYDGNSNTITWSVMLDREIPEYQEPLAYTIGYQFEDALGDKQTYVPDSLRVTVGSASESTPSADSVKVNTEDNVLTYTLEQELSADTVITYQTTPTPDIFIGGDIDSKHMLADMTKGVKVSNRAELFTPDRADSLGRASETVKVSGDTWLAKAGKETDFANGTTTWEIVIHTNGIGFESITLHDELLSDNMTWDSDRAKLTVMGGKVGDANALISSGSEEGTYTLNSSFDGETATELLTLNRPAYAEYVVTYRTKISEESLAGNDGVSLKNRARLDYAWKTGEGPDPVQYGVPSVEKDHNIGASMVKKDGKYDQATGLITWTATLNTNRRAVSNAVITDTFVNSNQKIVQQDGAPLGNPQITMVNGAEGPGDYTIEMTHTGDDAEADTSAYNVSILKKNSTDWGNDGVTFTYQTQATDPQFYACNVKNEMFTNTVDFGPSGALTLSATAKPTFTSTVLTKTSEGYDYSNHEISWKVAVAQRAGGAEIGDAVFTDELPPYLSYVDGSFAVAGAVYNAGSLTKPTAENGNTLSYAVGSTADGEVVLTFRTKLDVASEALPGGFSFLTGNTASDSGKKLTVLNEAKLASAALGTNTGSTADVVIANTAFDKTAAVNEGNYTAEYAIKINQAGVEMNPLAVDGDYILTDTLGENLIFDADSVKLYKAKVTKDGAFTAFGDEISGVTVAVNGRTVTLTLPLEDDSDSPYLLTYRIFVNINSAGNFDLINAAVFGGSGSGVSNENAAAFHSAYSNGGATRIPGRAGLELTKTETGVTTPVGGAVYGLYEGNPISPDAGPVQTAVTNAQGKAIFAALKINGAYSVKELTAPVGFVLDTSVYPVTVTVAAGKMQTLAVSDARLYGGVSFQKADQYGRPAAGAEFALYKSTAVIGTDTALATAVSDPGGNVLFEGLTINTAYKFVESAAPADYTKSDEVFTFSIGADGRPTAILNSIGTEVTTVVNQSATPPVTPPESNGGGGGHTPNEPTAPVIPEIPVTPPVTPEVPITPPTAPTVPIVIPQASATAPAPEGPATPIAPVTLQEVSTLPHIPSSRLPDPGDPDSPDNFVLIDENGVPLGVYNKVMYSNGVFAYILDEDIPLADVPETGDRGALWLAAALFSGGLLAVVWVGPYKKRKGRV